MLGVLLAHLFAPRFAQPLIESLGRKRLPVKLAWGIDRSATDSRRRGCRLFRSGFARYRPRAIQAIQILIEIFERHIVLADLPGANLPLIGLGVFYAGHDPGLEVLAFLHELFHALEICLLRIRQSLGIARLPGGMRVETPPPCGSGVIERGEPRRPARGWSTACWRERLLDRASFFFRAAERRSVSVFFPAGFLLRAVFFFAILRSLSLGSHRAGVRVVNVLFVRSCKRAQPPPHLLGRLLWNQPAHSVGVDNDGESRSDMRQNTNTQPLSDDRVTRSEFDGLRHDTRAAFFAIRHEIESLRQDGSTNRRHCAAPQVEVDRLTARIAHHDPTIEHRAVERAKMVTCSHCGQDVDLPADERWSLPGLRPHAPSLVSVRCPQCGHQIDLVS